PGDDTRAPAGKETAWAYSHVPNDVPVDVDAFAARMEDEVEALAPGFRALVRRRHVFAPADLAAHRVSLGGGSAQLHPQVVLRPAPGRGGPETPVARLCLASASAHPGGGVHGAPGWIAARAALTAHSARRTTLALAALAAAGAVTRRAGGPPPRGGG